MSMGDPRTGMRTEAALMEQQILNKSKLGQHHGKPRSSKAAKIFVITFLTVLILIAGTVLLLLLTAQSDHQTDPK
jgi:hypothetical protein